MQSDMPAFLSGRHVKVAAFFGALSLAAIVHMAIPFVTAPTILQALWASGFAQSYVNHGWLAIHAVDFGLPQPAAIAFGLSGTVVQGVFIRLLGASPIDAYTMTIVFYLGVALYGSHALARRMGAPFYLALLLGLLWLSVPVVWNHGSYSMLMLGFALLPFYAYSSLALVEATTRRAVLLRGCQFVAVCILAIFMDGYTFVMFAASAGLIFASALITGRPSRVRSLVLSLPIMALGFGVAYFMYDAFVGTSDYDTVSLEFFRGWGVDVTMLGIPTRGLLWFWDATGIGLARSAALFWGDESVWVTTFIGPLLALGTLGFVFAENRPRAALWLAIAVFGIYFALGPSLKINSIKNRADIVEQDRGQLMPEKYAVMPTGAEWIYDRVPGLKYMRAIYRWTGMAALGLWALTVLLIIRLSSRHPILAALTIAFAITAFLPHVRDRTLAAVDSRHRVQMIDSGVSKELATAIGQNNIAVFVPFDNDFMVGYLAAMGGYRTYNIGGDKNGAMAQNAWSPAILALNRWQLSESSFWQNARLVLLDRKVDRVVFPYFDTVWASVDWPPRHSSLDARRQTLLPVAQQAADSSCFELTQYPMFSVMSLSAAGRAFVASGAQIHSYTETARDLCKDFSDS